MPLSAGEKLGAYEIVAAIGKGGMGEVWRARDPRLGRDVAIKVSAQQFTDRFEREARAIGALNHSNICTLFDVGPNYLVMELIEGPTLEDRIKEGPIPIEEALGIARQIADALEAAHGKGIVHRDLKPANVKIRPDGSVKVLDFGLAKADEPQEVTPDSPTMMPGTQIGMILGTAGYMSPEQARGKQVDKRADIWAFGVVLYEMLTGKRLFKGETVSDMLAAVLKEEPDLTLAPERIRRLLRRCLERDPKNRLRDIGDAMPVLEEDVGRAATAASRPAWIAAGVLAVVAAIALGALWRQPKQVDRPLVRLDVDLGADVSLPAPSIGGSVAISPDGTRLAYASGNPKRLFTRRLDQSKATELAGTQGAGGPFFSPDGLWVAFLAGGKLYKAPVEGGAAVPLAEIDGFSGASWGADGNVLVGEAFGKGLVRIAAVGGNPEKVVGLGSGELTLAYPQILPGGKAVLFSTYRVFDVDKINIEVLTFADRHRKIVVRGGTSPRYLPTSSGVGHLVYVNKARLFAIPFDPDKLETRGTAVPVLDDVSYLSTTGSGQLDFSRSGTLVYRRESGGAATMNTLQWVDPTGKKAALRAKPGVYESPGLSPDGNRIALTVSEAGSQDIWVYDQQRDTMTRLTFGGEFYRFPIWSPDGQYVVFARRIGGGIFQARADGAGQPQALIHSDAYLIPSSFTPDGKRLAYFEGGRSQIWTVPLEDHGGQLKAGQPAQFLKSDFDDSAPTFSPDQQFLAYSSNESGKYEVYVRAFPPPASGQGGKWQISNGGAEGSYWSRQGHELLYQSGDQIMAVSYTVKGDTFMAEKPRVWIAKVGGTDWDLAPDGKRVLVLTPVESAEASKQEHEVVMLLNFFDELRRRVPTGK
jgi:Tol biopolymer transport system component/tRNA A-37 threonylcarbamoyl transferase component Bud32